MDAFDLFRTVADAENAVLGVGVDAALEAGWRLDQLVIRRHIDENRTQLAIAPLDLAICDVRFRFAGLALIVEERWLVTRPLPQPA